MATQKQRSETTRTVLLAAFRQSLLQKGLAATTTQSVLADTGLSKGALYHHFKSKTDIVEAIYTEESRQTLARAFTQADQASGPLAQLKSACLAWTREVRIPAVSQILFKIGPSALGVERAKAIEDAHSLKRIEALLQDAVKAGEINATNTKLMATYLNALVEQTALHDLRSGTDSLMLLDRSIEAIFAALRP